MLVSTENAWLQACLDVYRYLIFPFRLHVSIILSMFDCDTMGTWYTCIPSNGLE